MTETNVEIQTSIFTPTSLVVAVDYSIPTDPNYVVNLGSSTSDHTCFNHYESGLPSTPASTTCWGETLNGELYPGGWPNHLGPLSDTLWTTPQTFSTANANDEPEVTAAGGTHTCVIDDNATAACWGGNQYGQLGQALTSIAGQQFQEWREYQSVGAVEDDLFGHILQNVTAIDLGDEHSCAIADDKVYCWGRNNLKQLGNANSSVASSDRAIEVNIP